MMASMQATTPQQLAMMQQYAPQFARAQAGTTGAGMSAMRDVFAQQMPGAEQLAGRMGAAERRLNPELERMQMSMERYAGQPSPGARYMPGMRSAIETAGGPSRIDAALEEEAFTRMGKGLNERERRSMTENMRQATAGRGMFRGNRALLDEAIGMTEADEDRIMRNAMFAGDVSGQLMQRGGQRAELFGYGAEAEDVMRNRDMDRMNLAMGGRYARRIDPTEMLSSIYQAGGTAGAAAPTFDPYNAYAMNVGASNQSAAAAQAAANQKQGGIMNQMFKGLAGGFASGGGAALGRRMFS